MKVELPETRGADQNSPVVSVHSSLSLWFAIAETQKKQKQKRKRRNFWAQHVESQLFHSLAYSNCDRKSLRLICLWGLISLPFFFFCFLFIRWTKINLLKKKNVWCVTRQEIGSHTVRWGIYILHFSKFTLQIYNKEMK